MPSVRRPCGDGGNRPHFFLRLLPGKALFASGKPLPLLPAAAPQDFRRGPFCPVLAVQGHGLHPGARGSCRPAGRCHAAGPPLAAFSGFPGREAPGIALEAPDAGPTGNVPLSRFSLSGISPPPRGLTGSAQPPPEDAPSCDESLHRGNREPDLRALSRQQRSAV